MNPGPKHALSSARFWWAVAIAMTLHGTYGMCDRDAYRHDNKQHVLSLESSLSSKHGLGLVGPAELVKDPVILECSIAKCDTNPNKDLDPLWSYQKYGLQMVYEEICKQFPDRLQDGKFQVSLLDDGTDVSGNMLARIGACISGDILGINIPGSGVENANKHGNEALRFEVGDGQHLSSGDASFDIVMSSYILEHVPSPELYFQDMSRVLTPNGIGVIAWGPAWTSPKGHHIHEDMIENWEKELSVAHTGYANDGTFIPPWAHLYMPKQDMLDHLQTKGIPPQIAERIVVFIYDSHDINRVPYDKVKEAFMALPGETKILSTSQEISQSDLGVKQKRSIQKQHPGILQGQLGSGGTWIYHKAAA